MSARGVAGDVKPGRVSSVASDVTGNPGYPGACLSNDIGDSHAWTQVVLQKHNRDAALHKCRNEIRIVVFATAAPVTAVDINKNRTCRLTGGIYVQHLSGRATVRHIEPRFMRRSDFSTLVGSFSG